VKLFNNIYNVFISPEAAQRTRILTLKIQKEYSTLLLQS